MTGSAGGNRMSIARQSRHEFTRLPYDRRLAHARYRDRDTATRESSRVSNHGLAAPVRRVLKTHDEGAPIVGIDPVGLAGHQDRLLEMDALNSGLDALDASALRVVILRDAVDGFDARLELHGTLEDARGRDRLGRRRREAGNSETCQARICSPGAPFPPEPDLTPSCGREDSLRRHCRRTAD
jgi:hypothetical protein